MVRKAWAGKVPAFVGMALPMSKKRKAGREEAVSAMYCVGNCCCNTLQTAYTHRRKLTRPYTGAGCSSGSQDRACKRSPSLVSNMDLGILPHHWRAVFTEPKQVLVQEPV